MNNKILMRTLRINLLLILLLGAMFSNAAITLPSIFADKAILQQNTSVSVWGWASAKQTITVKPSWNNESYTATAGNDGYWITKIQTPAGGFTSYTITFSDDKGGIKTISDILIGEVWICSGQSNMEILVKESNNPEEEAKDADYPNIRIFKVAFKASFTPEKDVTGKWLSPTSGTVLSSNFGAIPFFFSRNLYKALNVPIGILHTAKGSACQETWLSEENIKGAAYAENVLAEARQGNMPEREQHVATLLYNGMFKPLVPFTVKGVCWYQGERNYIQPMEYKMLLDNFINSWREELEQPELPFLITQLSGFSGYNNDGWTSVQETQYNASKKFSNVFTVMSYDVGDSLNVHPTDKQTVSHRLSLAAQSMVYGQSVQAKAPSVKKVTFNGSSVGLSYMDVGDGLKIKNGGTNVHNFLIAGADNVFYQANAKIVAKDSIVLTASKVPSPKNVRYAFKNYNSNVNLYSSSGLPAVPFRTDATRTVVSIKSGNWYDPSTWGEAGVPTKDDNVTISSSHTVTNYADAAATKDICRNLTVDGTLYLSCKANANYITNVYGPVICNGVIDLGEGKKGAYLTFRGDAGLSGSGSAKLGGLALSSAYTNCLIDLPSVVVSSSLTITSSASKMIIGSNTNISGYAFSPSSSAGQENNYAYYEVYGKATFNLIYLCNNFSGTAKAKIVVKDGGELKATSDVTPIRNGSSVKGIGGSGCIFMVEKGAKFTYPTGKDPMQYTLDSNSNYDKNLVIGYYKGSIINGKVQDSDQGSSLENATDTETLIYYDYANRKLVSSSPLSELKIYNVLGQQIFNCSSPEQAVSIPEICRGLCVVKATNTLNNTEVVKILIK